MLFNYGRKLNGIMEQLNRMMLLAGNDKVEQTKECTDYSSVTTTKININKKHYIEIEFEIFSDGTFTVEIEIYLNDIFDDIYYYSLHYRSYSDEIFIRKYDFYLNRKKCTKKEFLNALKNSESEIRYNSNLQFKLF